MSSSTVNHRSHAGRVASAVGCVLCAAPVLRAAPPVLESVRPRGIERGREVTVTLSGKYLRPDARIITTLPGLVHAAPRDANAEDLRSRLPLTVQVPADAPVFGGSTASPATETSRPTATILATARTVGPISTPTATSAATGISS